MDREQNLTSEQITEKIENLVKKIQSWDGSSSVDSENEWRMHQQDVLRLLSEHPMQVHQLSTELKEKVTTIVNNYLLWSFNGYW